MAPAVDPAIAAQTRAPAGPRQTPAQQSSLATQGAPNGAQLLAQVRAPAVSGRHCPPQHWAPTEQGIPSPTQAVPADGPRQRSVPLASARQASAPAAQQSGDCMQSSPMARHAFGFEGGDIGPGIGAQRATPFGPPIQAPEQQSAAAVQPS